MKTSTDSFDRSIPILIDDQESSPIMSHPSSAFRTVLLPLLGLLCLLCLLAPPAFSQTDSARAPGDLGEFVDVELVNVEVWVTDGDGRPVEGLPAEAFRVEEDGDAVDLAYFAEVRGGLRTAAVSPPGADETSGATDSELAASEGAGEGAGTADPGHLDPGHLVIYFDDLHLSKQGRLRMVADLRTWLDDPDVDPERVLVLRQDQAIYVEAPFGSSREQIDQALDRLVRARTSQGSQATDRAAAVRYLETEWRIATQAAGSNPATGDIEAGCGSFLNRALPFVESESRRLQQKVNTSLEHLYAVSGFLSAIPGVKSLVYVADSLETTPGSSLEAFVSGLCRTSILGREKPDVAGALNESFRDLARNAAANRVTFYGLQTGGLRVNSALSAQNEVVDLRSASRYQSELRHAERAGLQYLAEETGGRAVFNQNDLGPSLRGIVHDTAGFYSLAYAPDHAGDGHEHAIRVRLTDGYDRRGLRVRHRLGYQHKAADTRLGERLQAALFMGLGDNPLQVQLGAGTPSPSALATTPDFLVPLHVYVPASAVTFVPGENGSEARVFVQVALRDTRGGKPQIVDKTWTIQGPAAAEATLDLKMNLEVDGGLSTVAVAVRDEWSREISFVSTSIALPEASPVPSPSSSAARSRTP